MSIYPIEIIEINNKKTIPPRTDSDIINETKSIELSRQTQWYLTFTNIYNQINPEIIERLHHIIHEITNISIAKQSVRLFIEIKIKNRHPIYIQNIKSQIYFILGFVTKKTIQPRDVQFLFIASCI